MAPLPREPGENSREAPPIIGKNFLDVFIVLYASILKRRNTETGDFEPAKHSQIRIFEITGYSESTIRAKIKELRETDGLIEEMYHPYDKRQKMYVSSNNGDQIVKYFKGTPLTDYIESHIDFIASSYPRYRMTISRLALKGTASLAIIAIFSLIFYQYYTMNTLNQRLAAMDSELSRAREETSRLNQQIAVEPDVGSRTLAYTNPSRVPLADLFRPELTLRQGFRADPERLSEEEPSAPSTQLAAAPSAPPAAIPRAKPPRGGENEVEIAALASESSRIPSSGSTPLAVVAAAAPRPDTDPLPGNETFIWPVRGRVINDFGTQGDGSRNDGINIAAPEGTTVLASADGTVIYSREDLSGYGILILIQHKHGWVTSYAHLSHANVSRGDRVVAGQPIGMVGSTGLVPDEQPQLHFELRLNSKPVDPLPHLISR